VEHWWKKEAKVFFFNDWLINAAKTVSKMMSAIV